MKVVVVMKVFDSPCNKIQIRVKHIAHISLANQTLANFKEKQTKLS